MLKMYVDLIVNLFDSLKKGLVTLIESYTP